jgi:cyclohexadienyl dehydratase
MMRGILLLTLLLPLSCVVNAEIPPAQVTLLQLIDQRLDHMKAVAAYKWHNKLAVEDVNRERLVISKAVQLAENNGLDRESSRAFFIAQIQAAKNIQTTWLKAWQQGSAPLPGSNHDLTNEIRPALLLLGDQIISQIALLLLQQDLQFEAADPQPFSTLSTEHLTSSDKRKILEALEQIHLSQPEAQSSRSQTNRLSTIRSAGVLRVGTTGDYAPFSYYVSEIPTGIDIDLAKELARSLGVKLQFIKTSWPTLMTDLEADKYDIGMSGISWNVQRNSAAFFSIAYHQGGKTAITRCADVAKYDELGKIDQPGVRVIVNPGGTNQKFVNEHIAKANIRVFDDNTHIFNEIIAAKADVMITDLIEVRLQSSRHPELCGSMKNRTLSHLEKAFLLPQDLLWKRYIDAWLFQQKQNGAVSKAFNRHLETS